MRRRARGLADVRLGSALALGLVACGGAPNASNEDEAPIEIVIDDLGVPHVYADTDEDLFHGYGYQLATDRLLQLEMWRRFALGRRAEILGADFKGSFGATALHDDKLVRLFDLPRWGKLDAQRMREEYPERWRLVQAWRAGINRRIEEVRSGEVPLPFGFGPEDLDFLPEPWGQDDPLIVQKMIQLGLDQSLLYEILTTLLGELAPSTLESAQIFLPAHDTFAVPPEDRPNIAKGGSGSSSSPFGIVLPEAAKSPAAWRRLISAPKPGSNNWAVAGRHTENGRPLLAGDPHLVFTLMGAMYAVHLNSLDRGGSYDVAGFAFAPAPGIFAGHTRGAIWAPTSAFGDVMDLWSVEVSEQGARIGNTIVPVSSREEVIPIRGGQSESILVRDVPGYGVLFDPSFAGVPVPLAGDGREVLLGWTGFEARSSLYFLELNRAESAEALEAAIERVPELSYNWVGADANDIVYRVSLEVPKRNPVAPGREPWRLMNGDDPLAFWPGGSLPLDQLPHGRGAERGFLVTANNDPVGFTADGDPGNDAWYYGAFYDPGYRARRIESVLDRLTERGGVTLEEMQALQFDSRCLMADTFLELLEEAWAHRASDPGLAEYVERPELERLVKLLVEEWDRKMTRDSSGAVAFHAFAHFTTAEAIEDDMIPLLYERVLEAAPFYLLKVAALALSGKYPEGDALLQQGKHRIVLAGLAKTAAHLTARFGGVEPSLYRWGEVHVTSFDNAYGIGVPLRSVPSDGGENTVNVAHSVFRRDFAVPDRWVSDYGPVERLVGRFDESGTPEVWVNFPLGNVADRSSPHFDDMTDSWAEGRYEKLAFRRDEVESRAESRLRLASATAR
ncbi:MAG: penicillin acylase family protein [Polyangiaceae bacterium]